METGHPQLSPVQPSWHTHRPDTHTPLPEAHTDTHRVLQRSFMNANGLRLFLQCAPHLHTPGLLRTGRRIRLSRSASRTLRPAGSAHTHTCHTHTLPDRCSPRRLRLLCSSGLNLCLSPELVRDQASAPDWCCLAFRCTVIGCRHCSASSGRSCSDIWSGSGPRWIHYIPQGGPSLLHPHLHRGRDTSACQW